MRLTIRLCFAALAAAMCTTALWACSDDADPPNTSADAGGDSAATPEAGGDVATPDGSGGSDAQPDTTQPPKACAFIDDGGAQVPELVPAACARCVGENCCAALTKCYGAAPADAGLDGANGVKSACALYGECEGRCGAAFPQGSPDLILCEFNCTQEYGQASQQDFAFSEQCRYGAPPAGCRNFCP